MSDSRASGAGAVGQDDVWSDAFSDEAIGPRQGTGNAGAALLQAALSTENLLRAFKCVRALVGLPLREDVSGAKALLEKLNQNPNLQKLVAARDAGLPAFVAGVKARMTGARAAAL